MLHHAHHIPVGPALHYLAPGDAVDSYPGPYEFPVRGLDAHKRAPVRPHRCEAGDYKFTFGDLDVDRVMEVREGTAKFLREGLHRLDTMEFTGIPRLVMMMVDVVGSVDLIGGTQISRGPDANSIPKYKQINSDRCKMRAKEEFMKPIRVPELAPQQLAQLEKLYHTTRNVRLRTRAQMVLLAAERHLTAAQIAEIVRASEETVRRWLKRYLAEGVEGLRDENRNRERRAG